MQTAASPGLRRFLGARREGGVEARAAGFEAWDALRGVFFAEGGFVAEEGARGEKVFAWTTRRPELVISERVNSSLASVSSLFSESSSFLLRFFFFFTMCWSKPAVLLPALLPLGRPPRPLVALPRADAGDAPLAEADADASA